MWHENTEEIEVMFSCWCSCCKCNWHCNFMQLTQLVKTCLCPRHPCCCYHHRPPGNAWVHLPHWRGLLGQVQFQLLIKVVIFLRKLALNILNVDEEHLDYYEWERFARHLFLIVVITFFFQCSATSSLTTAWSEQAKRKEKWLWTSLFDTWSMQSMNSAESGDFPPYFKRTALKPSDYQLSGCRINNLLVDSWFWDKMPGTGRGSFISSLHKRLPLPTEAAW